MNPKHDSNSVGNEVENVDVAPIGCDELTQLASHYHKAHMAEDDRPSCGEPCCTGSDLLLAR